jgi:hypothetical protein
MQVCQTPLHLINRRALIAALFCIPSLTGDLALAAESGPHVLITLPDDFSLEIRYKDKSVKLTAEDILSGLQPPAIKETIGRSPSRSMNFLDFVSNTVAQ